MNKIKKYNKLSESNKKSIYFCIYQYLEHNIEECINHVKKLKNEVNKIDMPTTWSPLIYNVSKSSDKTINITKILIENGANINYITNKNETALLISTNINNTILLIENGANWNIEDSFGDTFLDILSIENKNLIINKFPKLYENYLMLKKIKDFNI
jgi:ankyrin repeat protein